MRVTLLHNFNLLVLSMLLAGAGCGFAFVAFGGSPQSPNALPKPYVADARRSETRWQQVSQADAPVTRERGETIYQGFCSACHGATRMGVPPVFPSLVDVSKRQSDAEIASQIRHGKGRMLAFPDMSDGDMKSLLLFLKASPQPDAAKPSNLDATQWRLSLRWAERRIQLANDLRLSDFMART